MTPQQRLERYEKALADYSYCAENYSNKVCWYYHIQYGFCNYFFNTYSQNNICASTFKKYLPELYKQGHFNLDDPHSYQYQYKGIENIKGITDRIEALKAAIKEVKTLIS